ncbi:MAG: hypothetical protein ACXWMT_03460, partial [Candidatus Binataceae bacterium]
TGPDGLWPRPEPPHRANQIFLEPLLFGHAASQPRITILNRTEIENFKQSDAEVVVPFQSDLSLSGTAPPIGHSQLRARLARE